MESTKHKLPKMHGHLSWIGSWLAKMLYAFPWLKLYFYCLQGMGSQDFNQACHSLG